MRQLLSDGRNSEHMRQRQPIAARQRTCCPDPIGDPDLGLSLGVAQRAPTPTLPTDLGLNPKSYKKMPHLSNAAHSAFYLHRLF